MSEYPASDKQINFIRTLIAERRDATGISDVDAAIAALVEQRLTKKGASAVIDQLLTTAKDEPKVDPAAEAERTARAAVAAKPANRFGGKCVLCNVYVPEGAGTYRKGQGARRWETLHLDGECPEDLQAKLNELLAGQGDGYFAIPFIGLDAERTDLTFFGIRTRENGDRFMVHTVGGHGDRDDMSFTWCERAITALAAVDRDEAMATYGRELGHCGDCGRELTDKASRDRGIGPTCASKAA